MVVLEESMMEVDKPSATSAAPKRKSIGSLDPNLFANGKRIKFESFPKATAKLTVSAASATLTQDEDVDRLGHFATRLGHWRDLNITDGFDKFVREIHKLSSKLVFVLNNKDVLAQKLIQHLNEGNELFLEPLYDLSAAFANDIQSQYFWPYFGQFIEAFGTSFLAITETPEIIQSGYTALTQIIRMVMRSVDQEQNEIKSLEVLKLSLNGLMKEKTTLPAHTHKLCASAFGQIIRRSKTKIECIEFLLEKCKSSSQNSNNNTELPAQILVRALKTTEKTVHEDADNIWGCVVDTIGIDNDSSIWNNLINAVAELPQKDKIKSFMEILLQKWISNVDEHLKNAKSMAAKFDVITKILHLCRGKKIKIDQLLVELICALVKKYSSLDFTEKQDPDFISNLTQCVKELCSYPTSEAVECVEAFIKSNIGLEEKFTILNDLTKMDHFDNYFKQNIVRSLMKHPDKTEGLLLAVSIFGSFIQHQLFSQEKLFTLSNPSIEFPCDNPKKADTIPNRLLKLLEEKLNEDPEKDILDKNILYCVMSFRPLDIDLAIKVLCQVLAKFVEETTDLEKMYISVRCLSELMSPREFLENMMDPQNGNLVPKLSQWIGDKWACQILAVILAKAELDNDHSSTNNWIQRNLIGPLHGQVLIEVLHKNLSQADRDLRFWILTCLTKMYPKIEVYQIMFNAEATEITDDRERVKHLTNLSWDSPCVQALHDQNNQIKMSIFRFLLAQFSINFKRLWAPTLKVIDSFVSGWEDWNNIWITWLDIFQEINVKAATKCGQDASELTKQQLAIYNYRNQLLNVITMCAPLTRIAEKNNAEICRLFLDVFMKCETKAKDGDGLHAYLALFGKFFDLKSMSKYESVKNIAENCLGHFISRIREAAIKFFLAAHKVLRQHKEILTDLVDAKKWKNALSTLPDDIAKTEDAKVKTMLFYILGAKFKQTIRDKRQAQMSNRKHLVRIIFQVLGQEEGIEFLHQFVKKEAPFIDSDDNDLPDLDPKEMVKKMAMIFDILIISAQSAAGVKNVFKDILDVMECEGKLLVNGQIKQPLLLSKERSLLLQHLLLAYETLKECDWTKEDHYRIMKMCVWPLLNPQTSDKETNQQQYQYLSKTVDLFKCWIRHYTNLFFLEDFNVSSWICHSILESNIVEANFKETILNVTCSLVFEIVDMEHQDLVEPLKEKVLPVLGQCLKDWLNRGKIKLDKESAIKFKALTFSAKSKCLTQENLDFFTKRLFELVPKWKGQVQAEALNVLNSISSLTNYEVNLKAYHLISSIHGRDGRNIAAQLLWKSLDNPKNVKLNDNLLINEEYKKFFEEEEEKDFNLNNFLWMYHFASSEIVLSESEFAERNAAGVCVRDLIQQAKKQLSIEKFREITDSELVPVISKGLMAKHDRVQAEFIQILTGTITEDGCLGSIQGLHDLQCDDKNEDETNFLDNMRHIQKHRRGRAMRRLVKQIKDEEKNNIEENTNSTEDDQHKKIREIDVNLCFKIILPMTRTYLYNQDYVQQNEIITSAISCIGAIASKLPWKNYVKLLQQFLSQKQLEPPFQKQRVKVLASILDNFHFTDATTMTKVKKILENLLRKKSTTGHTFFKDGVEETQTGDLTLYVPIMKILMLMPEEELNHHASTLIVKVASQMKSRRLEERQLAREILCEMAAILGPKYLHHMISILKAQLQRGYQVHILVYTTHAILSMVVNKCPPNEAIDLVVEPVLEMVNDELFSNLMEEKKVAALVKKTAEAKKTVSYHMLELLSLHMSKSMVGPMLTKLLKSVKMSSSFESGQKISKAGKSILQGLLKNQQFQRSDFINLGYGLLSGKLVQLPLSAAKPKFIEELAFALLHAAANPGSNQNDRPLTSEELRPFLAFMQQGLQSKDVGTSTACLKFVVAVTQQSKSVVDFMLEFTDFVELVWKRCQLYVRMRSQPCYSLACHALRNLINQASTYNKFTTERIKTMCLFFKGSLEETNDDVSALQMIGLLLFKYYKKHGAEALEPYLKLLCSSGLRCRDEESFGVSKAILWKIIKTHKVCFKPAITYFAVNIDIEDERARWRSVQMCKEIYSRIEYGDKQKAKYDAKGLFLHAVKTYCDEESNRCKKVLEDLIKVIGREFAQKRGIESEIHHLIVDWLEAKDPILVGLGCKIMALLLEDEQGVQVKTTLDVANKRVRNFLQRPLELIDEDEVNLQYAVAITYGLQLLRALIVEANKEDVVKASVSVDTLTNLLLHSCVEVRLEAINLIQTLLFNEEAEANGALGNDGWVTFSNLRRILDNLCELVKSQPTEEFTDVLVQALSGLTLMILRSSTTKSSEDSEKFTKTILKKTRGFFSYEKVNHHKEWIRRQVYYRFVVEVFKGIDHNKGQRNKAGSTLLTPTPSTEIFVQHHLEKKHHFKDGKQAQLEAVTSQVQEFCEKWRINMANNSSAT